MTYHSKVMASEKKKVEHITSGVIRYVHFDEDMNRTYIVEMDDYYAKCRIHNNELIIIEEYLTEDQMIEKNEGIDR